MSVVVVIPSRGRPERAWQAVQAVRETAALVTTSVTLVVDAEDPELEAYRALRWGQRFLAETWLTVLEPEASGNLVRATNTVATRIATDDPDTIIGNLGDDHLCRTPGWDRAVALALTSPGIAYGDDLLQGERLPTAPFVSGRIVAALGWYFLPSLEHMFVDDALKAIGERLGILHYLPDVVIEHLHPGAGKAETDAGYLRADASTNRDRAAFEAWLAGGLRFEAARLQERLAVAA